eukprot:6473194-Amphidinium_carterae.6
MSLGLLAWFGSLGCCLGLCASQGGLSFLVLHIPHTPAKTRSWRYVDDYVPKPLYSPVKIVRTFVLVLSFIVMWSKVATNCAIYYHMSKATWEKTMMACFFA